MTGNVPFLMKDVVLLAVSFNLLKQDAVRMPSIVRLGNHRTLVLGSKPAKLKQARLERECRGAAQPFAAEVNRQHEEHGYPEKPDEPRRSACPNRGCSPRTDPRAGRGARE